MKSDTGKWHFQTIGRIVFFVTLSIAIMVALLFSLRNLNRTLYMERNQNTLLLMESVSKNIETSIDSRMDMVDYYINLFESEQYASIADAQSELETMRKIGGEEVARLYLVDDSSYCYQDDGQRFRWRSSDVLLSGKKECMLSSEEFHVADDGPYMLFVSPLNSPAVLGECTVTHLIMAVTMEFTDSFFDVAQFGDDSVSFILRSNGVQVYKQNKENDLAKVHNLLKALEDATWFYDGSLDRLKENIAQRRSDCMFVEYNGSRYYLANSPLDINGWISVMLVEEDHISSVSDEFVISVMLAMGIIALAAIVFIVGSVVMATRSANRRLAQAAKAEHDANTAKTKFLSSMSHDIRTPMNAIIGMTRLAREHRTDTAYVEECLSKVEVASSHLLTLINDVLDISKVESGKMRLNEMLCSLEDEIDLMVEIITPHSKEKEQEFTCTMTGLKNKMVFADKLRINQVILNLLSNAVKYTGAGGKVSLNVSGEPLPDENKLQITFCISDNGVGMSEEFQKTMYDTFTREQSEPHQGIQGTGLGLAICKQMTELLGGTIKCESKLGVGTTFTVTIALEQAADRDPAELKVEQKGLDMNSLKGVRILIAEDNELNWMVASEMLKFSGIETTWAENGQICVDMINAAKDGEYDLILMDIQMPVMNGYQATEAIRASSRPYLKSIPIFAMTADAFAEDVFKCIEVGMNAHISKPIDIEKLLQMIKNRGE